MKFQEGRDRRRISDYDIEWIWGFPGSLLQACFCLVHISRLNRTFLFMAYSFVVMSLAIRVVITVARYVSFTNRYSREDLCQYK